MTTLMVIGVVAALTIPSMIQSYKERETIVKLKKTYSMLAQATKLAEAEYGPPQTWGMPDEKGFKKIAEFIKFEKDCSNLYGSGCIPNDYKNIIGDSATGLYTNSGSYDTADFIETKHILNDGTIIFTDTLSSNCESTTYPAFLNNLCLYIFVDTNGTKGPNQAGHDLFHFALTKNNSIIPMGNREKLTTTNYYGCNYKASLSGGTGCTLWVMEKGNMDYLRKKISW